MLGWTTLKRLGETDAMGHYSIADANPVGLVDIYAFAQGYVDNHGHPISVRAGKVPTIDFKMPRQTFPDVMLPHTSGAQLSATHVKAGQTVTFSVHITKGKNGPLSAENFAVNGALSQSVLLDAPLLSRLWVYTNYDCNLRCAYCLVSSSPTTPRRGLPLDIFRRLVDEAVAMGCTEVFLTGGEPAIVPHITDMIAYATPHLRTIMLTNGMLWRRTRLARLEAVKHPNLTVQISLDSGTPDLHDYYRGAGAWARTVEGIKTLRERGFQVRTGTTETMHSRRRLRELRDFLCSIGIPEEDQILRPLARRGNSRQGAVLEREDLVPELTVDVDGVYWHPVAPTDDLRISHAIFPLRAAVARAEQMWHDMGGQQPARVFQ